VTLIHGFAKIIKDPILQGAGPDVFIGIGRHEDRRNRIPSIDEMPVEIDSGHSGHMDVGDQASGFHQTRRREEIGGRRESLDAVA